MKPIEIIVPYITPSWNVIYSNGNWRGRAKIVDVERERIWKELLALNRPELREPLDYKVNISIHQHKIGRQDSDNVTAKLWIDSLCEYGLLEDDSQKYVGWVSTRCDHVKRKDEQRTEIILTEDNG